MFHLLVRDRIVPLLSFLQRDAYGALVMRAVHRQNLQPREGLADLFQFADITTERTDQVVDSRIAPGALSTRDSVLETGQDIIIYWHQRHLLHTCCLGLLDHLLQAVGTIEHSIVDQTSISQFQLLGGKTLTTARSTCHDHQIFLSQQLGLLQHLLVGGIDNQFFGLLIIEGIGTSVA